MAIKLFDFKNYKATCSIGFENETSSHFVNIHVDLKGDLDGFFSDYKMGFGIEANAQQCFEELSEAFVQKVGDAVHAVISATV